jgi:hypothetical protein
MPHYRIELEGQNFLMSMEEASVRVGFFVTRFVEAAKPSEAETNALQVLRQERSLSALLNAPDDPPMVYVNAVEPVSASDVPGVAPGFVFFPADEDV